MLPFKKVEMYNKTLLFFHTNKKELSVLRITVSLSVLSKIKY
jgi:hypothetical protein